ncbi:hypothetical protein BD410DRAFT_81991 [Rickenella mellea]|uniref:Uncharacterized protein n=1 Tax=Rickenella mellea TaxID=50990 RepID=A0A4Y7PK78_9AGAM|nr:hypothetical protein BD410DRAFT_81991 [Rickenella mellea]
MWCIHDADASFVADILFACLLGIEGGRHRRTARTKRNSWVPFIYMGADDACSPLAN